MSLAFLTALLQHFIPLLCCPKQKSGLLLPVIHSPLLRKVQDRPLLPQVSLQALNLVPKIGVVLPYIDLQQGLITRGLQNAELPSSDFCKDKGVCMLPPWHCLPENLPSR